MSASIFNLDLIQKYAKQGPRYTSYPTAVEFRESFSKAQLVKAFEFGNKVNKPLSLYVHIPFCETLCYFCGCNKVITKNKDQARDYLDLLEKELLLIKPYIDSNRTLIQLHWGGGTPTFLSAAEQVRLMNLFKQYFNFADDKTGEFSIEIDPRTVTQNSIKLLRKMGFNRLSFGIQDFEKKVQLAVNRLQSEKETALAIEEARKQGFHSVSVDLIYGLPLQTKKSFAQTLDKIIDLSPDRIALFNYAHMPHIFKPQKQIVEDQLPSSKQKLQLLELSINKLVDAGYHFIGLDHFAKPGDSLVTHQKQGTLYRNFQGYSTFSNADLIGLGVSAISQIGDTYSQNLKNRFDYGDAINQQMIPLARGIALNQDDKLRRHVITEIMCNMKVNFQSINKLFDIDFKAYFNIEIEQLKQIEKDQLIQLSDTGFKVLTPGRLLIRNVAMVFDAYLQTNNKKQFSKVI